MECIYLIFYRIGYPYLTVICCFLNETEGIIENREQQPSEEQSVCPKPNGVPDFQLACQFRGEDSICCPEQSELMRRFDIDNAFFPPSKADGLLEWLGVGVERFI